jgi:hypothetical protein
LLSQLRGFGTLYEAWRFSDCGTYFLVRDRIRVQEVTPVPIPQSFLGQSGSLIPATFGTTFGQSEISLTAPLQNHQVIRSLGSSTLDLSRAHVSSDGNVASLATETSANEIQLVQRSSLGTQAAKLVSLPTWTGAEPNHAAHHNAGIQRRYIEDKPGYGSSRKLPPLRLSIV